MSKSTNAYIKSQDGLPGFYSTEHDNSSSWFFEVRHAYGIMKMDPSMQSKLRSINAPLDKTPVQFGYYLRRNEPELLQSLTKESLCPKKLRSLTVPDFKMTNWSKSGPYHCDWETSGVPKIDSNKLKGSKLAVYGTLDWNDQGWGNRKG